MLHVKVFCVFQVTQQHDAVLAFYYMDGENKMKVTEIFEVTPAESEAIFPHPDLTTEGTLTLN